MNSLVIFVFGLIIGSFLAAFTYRYPLGISISRGRSKCPKCKKNIEWYDNIPLLSFLLLKGKCRNCKKKISFRYPLIELSSGILFYSTFQYPLSGDLDNIAQLVLYLILTSALIAVFVIDFEHQIIPDELVFFLIFLSLTHTVFQPSLELFKHILSGFGAASFLLFLNVVTFGRGMGLGDVKLALFSGFFLGLPGTIVWMFLSFVIGGAVGVILLTLGKAKLGKPIPFGPFLVASFFVTWFWGDILAQILMPYW